MPYDPVQVLALIDVARDDACAEAGVQTMAQVIAAKDAAIAARDATISAKNAEISSLNAQLQDVQTEANVMGIALASARNARNAEKAAQAALDAALAP